MAIVKLEWYRKSVSDKLIDGAFISQEMAANAAVFVAPNPSLADLDAANLDLTKKAVAAKAGGYALTFAKNQAEKAYDALITNLVSYVQNVSGGEESIILLSGMGVRKKPSPTPDPEQVENLDAYPTRTQGEVQLTWDSLGDNYDYKVEMWIDEDGKDGFWEPKGTPSGAKLLIKNLNTGGIYRFRVAGLATGNRIGPFSQEASSVAP